MLFAALVPVIFVLLFGFIAIRAALEQKRSFEHHNKEFWEHIARMDALHEKHVKFMASLKDKP